MTAMEHGVSVAERITSVPALCRRESWRFASLWSDFLLMGVIAAVTWVIVANHYVSNTLTASLGPITMTAIAMCVGGILPLLARLSGAWRFGQRLNLGPGGDSSAGIRSQFLAASLQQAGTSAMRCSVEDLRRTVTVAASVAAQSARSAAMPARVAAFIAPAVALIGGLDMANRSGKNPPIAAFAPSVIAGIASGLFVVLLAEAFAVVVRNGVERWGAGVNLDEVAHLAGRPVSRVVHPVASDDGRGGVVTTNSSSTVAVDDYEQTLKNLTRSG
jgi:hypothetical protein